MTKLAEPIVKIEVCPCCGLPVQNESCGCGLTERLEAEGCFESLDSEDWSDIT